MSGTGERAKTKKGEQTRQVILRAARRCFEQFGYAKTTMDDIAKACPITKSSLFYYYDSKESLFYYSFTKIWEDALKELIEQARVHSPPDTRIQDYIRASAEYYAEVVAKFGTSVSVLVETEEHFADILQPQVHAPIISFFKDVLDEGCQEGRLYIPDTKRVAELIGRIERSFRADAFLYSLRQDIPKVDFDQLADDTCDVVTHLLAGLSKPNI